MEKMTKKEMFAAIVEYINGAEVEGVTSVEMCDFLNEQIALLDRRSAKAKERAAKRKAEDPLYDQVMAVLTDEYMPIKAIVEAIGDEEVTNAKVVARLCKGVKAGLVEKDKDKKVTVYRLIAQAE